MREIGGACGTYERQERCLQVFGGGDLRGRDNLQDADVDARIILQDRQCTLNATMTDTFAKPLLPWKSSNYCKFRVCVCSLSYPAQNAWRRILPPSVVCLSGWLAVPYFSTHLINGMSFGEVEIKVIGCKMCFDFLFNVCLKHFPF